MCETRQKTQTESFLRLNASRYKQKMAYRRLFLDSLWASSPPLASGNSPDRRRRLCSSRGPQSRASGPQSPGNICLPLDSSVRDILMGVQMNNRDDFDKSLFQICFRLNSFLKVTNSIKPRYVIRSNGVYVSLTWVVFTFELLCWLHQKQFCTLFLIIKMY